MKFLFVLFGDFLYGLYVLTVDFLFLSLHFMNQKLHRIILFGIELILFEPQLKVFNVKNLLFTLFIL